MRRERGEEEGAEEEQTAEADGEGSSPQGEGPDAAHIGNGKDR